MDPHKHHTSTTCIPKSNVQMFCDTMFKKAVVQIAQCPSVYQVAQPLLLKGAGRYEFLVHVVLY